MGDIESGRRPLDVGIAALVREMAPSALCDACLAFALQVSLDDVHAAVLRILNVTLDFTRKSSECYRCTRPLELLVTR